MKVAQIRIEKDQIPCDLCCLLLKKCEKDLSHIRAKKLDLGHFCLQSERQLNCVGRPFAAEQVVCRACKRAFQLKTAADAAGNSPDESAEAEPYSNGGLKLKQGAKRGQICHD